MAMERKRFVVVDGLCAGRISGRDQVAHRHHVSGLRSHIQLIDITRRRSVLLVGLHIHPVRPALQVEVVHIAAILN